MYSVDATFIFFPTDAKSNNFGDPCAPIPTVNWIRRTLRTPLKMMEELKKGDGLGWARRENGTAMDDRAVMSPWHSAPWRKLWLSVLRAQSAYSASQKELCMTDVLSHA